MKTEPMDVREALGRGKALPYALVRSLSSVALGPAPETVDLDELIEARFFGEEEVRLFRDGADLRAVCLTQEEGDVVIDRCCALANRSAFGGAITVRQVLEFDGDGQAFIACTRLTGWRGEADDAQ